MSNENLINKNSNNRKFIAEDSREKIRDLVKRLRIKEEDLLKELRIIRRRSYPF